MGLDTSHDCWHGSYMAFMRWRQKLAEVAGLPPLELMEGFYSDDFGSPFSLVKYSTDEILKKSIEERVLRYLPIKWECLKPSPLLTLLRHSDCDGSIESKDCSPIADALEELIPKLPDEDAGGHIGNWRDKTQQFVEGLRAAASAGEDVEFH